MVFSWPFSKQRKHKCYVDNKIVYRFVYKDVADAFPLTVTDHARRVHASTNALEGVKAHVAAEQKEQVSVVLVGLDSVNRSIQGHFNGIYVAYQNSPCENFDFFNRNLVRILDWELKLNALQISFDALTRLSTGAVLDKEKFSELFEKIIGSIVKIVESMGISSQAEPLTSHVISSAMRASRTAAGSWAGGQQW